MWLLIWPLGGSESDDSSSSGSESEDETVLLNEELERKSRHPYRLHPELWYNDQGKVGLVYRELWRGTSGSSAALTRTGYNDRTGVVVL